jgi:hypothetical protein
MMADSGAAAMEGALALANTHPTSQERIVRLGRKWEETENKFNFEKLPDWTKSWGTDVKDGGRVVEQQ